MNQHAGPPDDSPPVQEPTYAERARTLVYTARTGTLSTLSRRLPGHPFGSVTPYAIDPDGRPLLLISTMAMHTQNLMTDPRASLLVLQDGADDVLAGGRVTLVGHGIHLRGDDATAARSLYLERHPKAAYWVDFGDFGFWRLDLADIYFVGGFAAMDWIPAPEYSRARPDPLADAAAAIIHHMNVDHADAVLTFARVFTGENVQGATMVSVDRLGFKLQVQSEARVHSARIPFPGEVVTADQARAAFIAMLRDVRSRQTR